MLTKIIAVANIIIIIIVSPGLVPDPNVSICFYLLARVSSLCANEYNSEVQFHSEVVSTTTKQQTTDITCTEVEVLMTSQQHLKFRTGDDFSIWRFAEHLTNWQKVSRFESLWGPFLGLTLALSTIV